MFIGTDCYVKTREQRKIYILNTVGLNYNLFFLILSQGFVYRFLEGGREKERGRNMDVREKHGYERGTSISYLLYVFPQGIKAKA